jgi:hypothetical protein
MLNQVEGEEEVQSFNEPQSTLFRTKKNEEESKINQQETSIPEKKSLDYQKFLNLYLIKSFEYKSGKFLYSMSTLVPLVLGLFPILALTGKLFVFNFNSCSAVAIMVFGLTAVYVLDFLSFNRFTLPAFWITLCVFWIFTYFSSLIWLWFEF